MRAQAPFAPTAGLRTSLVIRGFARTPAAERSRKVAAQPLLRSSPIAGLGGSPATAAACLPVTGSSGAASRADHACGNAPQPSGGAEKAADKGLPATRSDHRAAVVTLSRNSRSFMSTAVGMADEMRSQYTHPGHVLVAALYQFTYSQDYRLTTDPGEVGSSSVHTRGLTGNWHAFLTHGLRHDVACLGQGLWIAPCANTTHDCPTCDIHVSHTKPCKHEHGSGEFQGLGCAKRTSGLVLNLCLHPPSLQFAPIKQFGTTLATYGVGLDDVQRALRTYLRQAPILKKYRGEDYAEETRLTRDLQRQALLLASESGDRQDDWQDAPASSSVDSRAMLPICTSRRQGV
jgi:hypothetical protein